MLIAATRRLAELSPALKSHQGETGKEGHLQDEDGDLPPLLPDFADAPEVNFEVALAVAKCAMDEGIAQVSYGTEELRKHAEEGRWLPVYPKYEFDPNGET
jgi:malate dehydrogenase (oxaloacetate-decarboxylating)